MICYDTNYIVEFVSNGKLSSIEQGSIISRISYIEFLSYKLIPQDTLLLHKEFLSKYFEIVEIDETISDTAAQIRRSIVGLRLADSVILATSFITDSELKTHDKRLQKYYEQFV